MQASPPTILACGHEPSAHGPHTTGTCKLPYGREVCVDCGNVWEAEQLKTAQHWSGYMKLTWDSPAGYSDRGQITNWVGHVIGTCHDVGRYRGNFGGWIYTFRATIGGAAWYGRGTGHGMICHLHRSKVRS